MGSCSTLGAAMSVLTSRAWPTSGNTWPLKAPRSVVRTTSSIALETVGGELNAYTTKEKICFHASVLDAHFDKALELLADISFRSVFPEKQLERERNVILEEMSMYYDSPEDAIQDDFDALLFPGHALGFNILGIQETVKRFTRADLRAFILENLDTERVIVSSVSRLPFAKVMKLAERYLGEVPQQHSARQRNPPSFYSPVQQKVERFLTQAQCAMGRPAYPLTDDRKLPFFALVNLLGGPGMNSRFNMSLRERYGFVYSIDAQLYGLSGRWVPGHLFWYRTPAIGPEYQSYSQRTEADA